MDFSWRRIGPAGLAACLAMAGLHAASGRSASQQPPVHRASPAPGVFSQALPPMDGQHLVVKLVAVTYPPGGSSRPHSHPCAVIVHVVEGALRMQVKGGPETIVRAGENYYETPNGTHAVSANASPTEPARFLAYFVCDHDTPLTVPPPGGKAPGVR